jgi:4-hydroxythreonine-4-phosphate dehydrogenase
VVGITLGDINGVGPEVALKAAQRRWPAGTRLVLIGSAPALAAQAAALEIPCPPAWDPATGVAPSRKVTCWDPTPGVRPRWRPGRLAADAGLAAHGWILAAVDGCLGGTLDAMVTAPINKAGFELAGVTFPGHTELLAHRTETRRFAMMLFGGPLRVVLVTRHLPLRAVAEAVTAPAIEEAVTLVHEALPWLGLPTGRIAVCGLNPHAGDGGRIGHEDRDIVAPVVRALRRRRIDVQGPFAADTVFHQARLGAFDAVVAMYHDQGLAPLKTIAFDEGVNLTLGLPIVRTSPDHGTAYPIAGTGVAREASMVEAIRTALMLTHRPNPWRRTPPPRP